MIEPNLLVPLMSGALGAAFGASITYLVAQRRLHSDHVTAERTKWRDKIRALALELVGDDAAARKSAWISLALNTNPYHAEDRALVKLARKIADRTPDESELDELAGRFALLLKHDWDRAKNETSWWPGPRDLQPPRLDYSEYKPNYSLEN